MVLGYLSLWIGLPCVAVVGYFFLTRETARYRRAIDRRLLEIAYPSGPTPLPKSFAWQPSEIAVQLQRSLRQADVQPVINRFVLLSLSVGLSVGVLALLLSGSGVATLAVTLGGMSAPLFAVLLVLLVR